MTETRNTCEIALCFARPAMEAVMCVVGVSIGRSMGGGRWAASWVWVSAWVLTKRGILS